MNDDYGFLSWGDDVCLFQDDTSGGDIEPRDE